MGTEHDYTMPECVLSRDVGPMLARTWFRAMAEWMAYFECGTYRIL